MKTTFALLLLSLMLTVWLSLLAGCCHRGTVWNGPARTGVTIRLTARANPALVEELRKGGAVLCASVLEWRIDPFDVHNPAHARALEAAQQAGGAALPYYRPASRTGSL